MLVVDKVSKNYKHDIALRDITLEFPATGLIFIDGDSGSGKSTLLNILSTLEQPDSGTLIYNGEELTKKNQLDYLKNTVSIIFQDVNLFPNLTVSDNLMIYDDTKSCDAILTYLGIASLKEKKVKDLSGGEKRRVAIARAILKQPAILLCDEPTSSLDRENAIKTFELLKKISKQLLVIVSSHDEDLISNYADRIINIHEGKIQIDTIINTCKEEELVSKPEIKIRPHFLTKVAHDFLFSNKLTFSIATILLTFFLMLILASNILAHYDYAKMQVRTLTKENDNLLIGENLANYKVRTIVDNDEALSFQVAESANLEGVSDYYRYDKNNVFLPFASLDVTDKLIGEAPKAENEIVIYQIAAEVLLNSGALLSDNTVLKDTNFEILLGKTLLFGTKEVKITGIIKQDTAEFAYLKNTSLVDKFDLKSTLQSFYFENKLDHYKYEYLVSPNFFSYMSDYPYLEYNGYGLEEKNTTKQKEILSKLNNQKYNIYTLLVNNSSIDIYGTIYSDSMAYVITLPFLIGSVLVLFLPIAIIIAIYITLMFFESVFKKNREKIALLLGLGCSKKDFNYLLFKALTTFMAISFSLATLLVLITLIISSKLLTKLVGFYFQPFSLNISYVLLLLLVLAFTFVLTLGLLRLRINKNKTIRYLKNN